MMNKIRGIVTPLITPLVSRDQLDHTGLERLLEHVTSGGVHSLFLLGTTGEAPSLSYRLRREVITRVAKQMAARLPLLVGVTDTSFVETVDLARHAYEAGAMAAVLSTPYYFPAGQTELLTYIENLLPELPLPLVLYNMPSLTKVWFEISTLEKLTQYEKIIGIKDSSGDLAYFEQAAALKSIRPDWSVMVGPEALLISSLKLSGDGGVNGGSNVFPSLFVECFHAYQRGDQHLASKLDAIIQAWQKVYDIGKYASRHIKATKCALSLLRICDDFMAEPFHRFKSPERARVEEMLHTIQSMLSGVFSA